MGRKLLVVGSRRGSLGWSIARRAEASEGQWEDVSTADLTVDSRDSQYRCDVTNRRSVVGLLEKVRPTDVVCTVGVNLPDGDRLLESMSRQLHVNTLGPVQLLVECLDFWKRGHFHKPGVIRQNFAMVSSNSAHIARSTSAGYCASKAALSMTMRCIARAQADEPVTIWTYEPGWIDGTNMSAEVGARLDPDLARHRIPGARTLSHRRLADRIVDDVWTADAYLNGTCIRLDGGEQ